MRRLTILTAAGVFALVALACGGNDASAPTASGNAMLASPEEAGTATPEAGDRTPVIERVALTPAKLIPGDDIRAIVEAADPDGDMLRFDYTWIFNGNQVQQGSKSIFHPVNLKKGEDSLGAFAYDAILDRLKQELDLLINERATAS